jgi:glyoxylase-like metal-dependent hydrolase (beta-lactamase superfamily II)
VTPRIDRVVTPGIFVLDGKEIDITNNVWLVGDDEEVVIIDASHDAAPIVDAVGDRRVVAIACTHAHKDHINVADELSRVTEAPVFVHMADSMLWDRVHPSRGPDGWLEDGILLRAGGAALHVLHTPGHSPGGVSLYAHALGVVFTGDTLFQGGPGATGRPFSDFGTIIESIRTRLLTLPPETVVHTGHGDSTTIGTEAGDLDEWIKRGW